MKERKIPFLEKIRTKNKYVNSGTILFFLTVFQLLSFIPAVINRTENKIYPIQALLLLAYIAFEWIYVVIMTIISKKRDFELELIAFFLCGIGLAEITSMKPMMLTTQLIAIILGVIIYTVLLWFLQNVERVIKFKLIIAVAAIGFFAVSFVYIRFVSGATNGAYNWIRIAGFSIQPAEFVKLAFIFVGAATLDKLLTTKNIVAWLIFVIGCLGILVLMRDFGTAMIFFVTFLLLIFMRSGDLKTIGISLGVAGLGGGALLILKPYVANRFKGWRHIWEHANESLGYQQVRTLIYSSSGGLLGLGIGQGKLRNIFAAENDLIFGVICEEMGILIGFSIVICFAIICVYSVFNAKTAPSTFYAISACAASSMLLFQTCLNIFGITDIIPLTGVTLPFISQGGSSMMCCWGLFAFIKAADLRSYPKLMNQN